eukprot:TRINITY_DN10676_c0_g3_i5.p1 TRINITY_DN10676_c0_g3~~TRINITY_DN10676_c0_g3_i5.p1  ORF type:complete len:431 (+),score=102.85 TRINITY_DN10676_c0_g3_i5:350-1642(+)
MWEEMITEHFADAFSDFFADHSLLIRLVKSTFEAVKAALTEARQDVTNTITSALHLPINSHEAFSAQYLAPIFQEFALNAFEFTEERYNLISTKLEEILEDTSQEVKTWLDSADLKKFLSILHRLYLHMELSEPKIELEAAKEGNYEKYRKEVYHCLDGFPKEGVKCVVVVPVPKKQGQAYQGIKAAIVMVSDAVSENSETLCKPFKDNSNIRKQINLKSESVEAHKSSNQHYHSLTKQASHSKNQSENQTHKDPHPNKRALNITPIRAANPMSLTAKFSRPADLVLGPFDKECVKTARSTKECLEAYGCAGEDVRRKVCKMWEEQGEGKSSGLRESMKLYRNKLEEYNMLQNKWQLIKNKFGGISKETNIDTGERVGLRKDAQKTINKKLLKFKKAIGLDKSYLLSSAKNSNVKYEQSGLFARKCTFLK